MVARLIVRITWSFLHSASRYHIERAISIFAGAFIICVSVFGRLRQFTNIPVSRPGSGILISKSGMLHFAQPRRSTFASRYLISETAESVIAAGFSNIETEESSNLMS